MIFAKNMIKRLLACPFVSRSEIMTILIYFHFNTFRNFKHYYLFYVKAHLHDLFPKAALI